uniref:Uncharacterized protein n=1 Tax=Panagrolaimus davidi TaxID=227884 RepID=A0A914QR46_9BILA
MDNKDYLIGLFDGNSDFKLLTQPCNILPHYDYCNYLLNSTAKITFCNALEMSRNLNKSGYSEVVLIGNAEIGNVRSFIPFGFGLIIGDREVIVFANDLKKIVAQIENYEIYGSGKETMVAIMAKKDIVLLGIYKPINFLETNVLLLKV